MCKVIIKYQGGLALTVDSLDILSAKHGTGNVCQPFQVLPGQFLFDGHFPARHLVIVLLDVQKFFVKHFQNLPHVSKYRQISRGLKFSIIILNRNWNIHEI